jgi:hypothetical protein
MAVSAASGSLISINPNPFDLPVSRSMTILVESTVPKRENAADKESLVAEKGRLPT